MIYLHPASACSPERIRAVEKTTGLTAVVDMDGKAIMSRKYGMPRVQGCTRVALPLCPQTSSSNCELSAATFTHRTGSDSPNDVAPGAVGIFSVDAQERESR